VRAAPPGPRSASARLATGSPLTEINWNRLVHSPFCMPRNRYSCDKKEGCVRHRRGKAKVRALLRRQLLNGELEQVGPLPFWMPQNRCSCEEAESQLAYGAVWTYGLQRVGARGHLY